jgi:hypothetical protein
MTEIKAQKEVDLVVSISDFEKIAEKRLIQSFELVPLLITKITSQNYKCIKKDLFANTFTKACCLIKNGTIRSAIYLDKEIVNTAHRKDYIVNDFIRRWLLKRN